MWIEVDNVLAKLTKATEPEARWLAEYLSFPDAKAHFRTRKMPKWKRGDGKIHMMSSMTNAFPAGFASQVVKAAAEEGFKVQLLDRRKPPIKPDATAVIDWLRPYQRDAIDVARTVERGVFHHPTGAGKTECMVALAEVYPVDWLILTHRKDLLLNTSERFLKRTGEVIGIIGEGRFDVRRVTVAMFQSVFAALKKHDDAMIRLLRSVKGVMIDECHVLPADSFWRVVLQLHSAYFRYGFSGTPFARGDKKSVFVWGALGPIVHKIKPQTLIDAGVLAKPEIRLTRVVNPDATSKTWTEAYAKSVVRSKPRNAAVLKQVAAATKPCLLFVNSVEHGKLLEGALRRKNEKVEFVWGKHALAVRRAAIERLVHGETDTLICNVIFQEGIDIPELQSVVIAQGGQSIIVALQRVGRGMRKRAHTGEVTKETFKVYDVADEKCGQCGAEHPHASCKWLAKHTRARIAAYSSAGYSVIVEST